MLYTNQGALIKTVQAHFRFGYACYGKSALDFYNAGLSVK